MYWHLERQCMCKCDNVWASVSMVWTRCQQCHNVWALLTYQQLWEYCLVSWDNTITILDLLSVNSCGVLCHRLLAGFLYCVGKYSWTAHLNMWLTPLLWWSASYLNRCKNNTKQQMSLEKKWARISSFFTV